MEDIYLAKTQILKNVLNMSRHPFFSLTNTTTLVPGTAAGMEDSGNRTVTYVFRCQWGELVDKLMGQWCRENKQSGMERVGSYENRIFYSGWSEKACLVRSYLSRGPKRVRKWDTKMCVCVGGAGGHWVEKVISVEKTWMTYNLCVKEHARRRKEHLGSSLRSDLHSNQTSHINLAMASLPGITHPD